MELSRCKSRKNQFPNELSAEDSTECGESALPLAEPMQFAV
jgi:hypothetical protein